METLALDCYTFAKPYSIFGAKQNRAHYARLHLTAKNFFEEFFFCQKLFREIVKKKTLSIDCRLRYTREVFDKQIK